MKEDTQPKLEYTNQGPCGYVVYKCGEHELRFFFEFGGSDCVAIIHVPLIEEWVTKTNLNLTERDKIIEFVALQAIKDQAPNCKYELQHNHILILIR